MRKYAELIFLSLIGRRRWDYSWRGKWKGKMILVFVDFFVFKMERA